MFDYRHNLLPISFSNTWKKNSEVYSRELRNANDFFRERTIAKYLQNHPLFYFPSLWNSLLAELDTSLNLDIDDSLKLIVSRKTFSSALFNGLIETLEF